MKDRKLLIAVVLTAVLAFGLGWFARQWSEPTPQDRIERASKDFQKALRDLGR
jgi:hypothetical protein